MRRILVALDGSNLSATILDDALRLAGPGGELVLMHAVNRQRGRAAAIYNAELDTEPAREYLEAVAEGLRTRGATVRTQAKLTFNVSAAIDDVARANRVDMIACATHSRGAIGRLVWGSVAWKTLASSPVPVLLRHPVMGAAPIFSASPPGLNAGVRAFAATHEHRRILVPLDGSQLAERALPLARTLATEWEAPVDLLRVIPDTAHGDPLAIAQTYLDRISGSFATEVHAHILTGSPEMEIAAFALGAGATDLVMTSHGRSGLDRVFLGSVTHDIVHRLSLPVLIVPALAAAEVEEHVDTREPATSLKG
ncbi:MAG TPA: universal stress protein [Chloroflexota bacterium]|nr:universal stress protein [Chloroflexota bacterium]